MKTRDWWLWFGCFLTGHKYELVKQCSHASAKTVIKYLSSMLLVSLVWGFVGFMFTRQYLHEGFFLSGIGAITLVFIVIQIERQIILTVGKNKHLAWFRIGIGCVIAIIGSIIIDQFLFDGDIQLAKRQEARNRMIADLDSQYVKINNEIHDKEADLNKVFDQYNKQPKTRAFGGSRDNYQKDSTGTLKLVGKVVDIVSVDNSIVKNIPLIDSTISLLRKKEFEISEQKTQLIGSEGVSEKNGKEDSGSRDNAFLNELNVMKKILFSSWLVLFVWGLFFTFFFAIELLVVFIKIFDKETDYDKAIEHQMKIRIRQLELLQKD